MFEYSGDFDPDSQLTTQKDVLALPLKLATILAGPRPCTILLNARIEVIDPAFWFGMSTYHQRTLCAYPKLAGANCGGTLKILNETIRKHIPKEGLVEVFVAEAGDGKQVWALVKDGCVKAIHWSTPASQP
jgi:hypothetical protein